MKLTYDLLHALETEKGGFTYATAKALGVRTPLRQGWLTGLIGREIPEEQYQKAKEGASIFCKKKKRWRKRRKNRTFAAPDFSI